MKLLRLFVLATVTLTATAFASTKDFNAAQKQQIESIVHNYLVEHPQVIAQAIQSLKQQAIQKQQKRIHQAVMSNKKIIFDASTSPSLGPKNAPITVVEFSDYQCGHCKDMAPGLTKIIKAHPNYRFIFKEFPIFGKNSLFAARAAIASNKQHKYLAFRDALMASKGPLTNKKTLAIAKKVGLNIAKLKVDMNNPAIAKELKQNYVLAQKLQLVGTPALIVANKGVKRFVLIPGEVNQQQLMQVINQVK